MVGKIRRTCAWIVDGVRERARLKAKIRVYARMKADGLDPLSVYRAAEAAGEPFLARLSILNSVFGISLEEAKEISLKSEDPTLTLEGHQESLIPALRQALLEAEEE